MERPYIVCHMVASVDGKVTGDFLFRSESADATAIYYRLNREMKADGFICGRVTMAESFTGGFYPELDCYEPLDAALCKEDYLADCSCGFYAIAFDTKGRLGWQSNCMIDPDGDEGYDGAAIVEVLSEAVDPRYLSYLRAMKISYLFAGRESIDVTVALHKLKTLFGCERLLLEGGSVINGAFLRANAIDELSLVVAPVVADYASKPLFWEAALAKFILTQAKEENGNLILRYKA